MTVEADQKSRQAVRRARRANPDAEIVVTGCSVQVGREAFAAADPAARLVDNRSKDALLEEIERLVGAGATERSTRASRGALPTLSGVEIEGIADGRASVERTRAFVKVQDGCSFFCTYCIIPAARGPERSLSPETVLLDVRRALRAGHREIVLTGINIGTYDGGWSERGFRGSHTRSALTLAGLVRRILDETPVERMRLSSIEPQHVDDELLRRLVRRRAADDAAPPPAAPVGRRRRAPPDGPALPLGRLRRGSSAASARRSRASRSTPTSSSASRPRTTRRGVARSTFIRSIGFAGIHVFRYSARPGTPAMRMAGQVDERAARSAAPAELLALAADARARWARGRVGGDGATSCSSRASTTADGLATRADHTLVAADADGDRATSRTPSAASASSGRPGDAATASSAASSTLVPPPPPEDSDAR